MLLQASTYHVDMVAIYGLGGGAYKTSTDDRGKLWLQVLLVEDLSGADLSGARIFPLQHCQNEGMK